MAGTIVADIIQSDQSYASSINIASPLVVSNTLTLSGGTITPTGNVNIDNGTLFINPTTNRVGVGTTNPSFPLDVVGEMQSNYYTSPSGSGYNSFQTGVDAAAEGWFVYDKNNSAYRVKINGSGHVTTPYQPYILRKATGGIGQSIPNATYTKVTCLNSTASSVGMTWDGTNHRTTILTTGLYLINYGIGFYGADGYLGADPIALIRVNGTTSGIVGGDGFYMVGFNSGAMPAYPATKYSFMLPLTKDDYVELWVYQDGGGARRLYEDFAYFQISLLG